MQPSSQPPPRALQRPGTRIYIEEGKQPMAKMIESARALAGVLTEQFAQKPIKVSLIEGVDPAIMCTMQDLGDLQIIVAVSGDVIIVQTELWPESAVKDTATFNRQVMLSEKLFGLANISLDRSAEGVVHYVAYGALRAESAPEDVVYEIEALGASVVEIAEAFRPYLKS
jgi:uncharacterized protein YjfI (DUF2170 family)